MSDKDAEIAALRERLNELENSFGQGPFRDGQLTAEIAALREQLATVTVERDYRPRMDDYERLEHQLADANKALAEARAMRAKAEFFLNHKNCTERVCEYNRSYPVCHKSWNWTDDQWLAAHGKGE